MDGFAHEALRRLPLAEACFRVWAFVAEESFLRGVFARSFTYLGGFSRNVHRYGEAAAIVVPETGRIWTYRELEAEANRLARALRSAGIVAGARIGPGTRSE